MANSLAGVEGGAVQVQGTINGFGERCGNANLCSVIPNLQDLQETHDYQCTSFAHLKQLTEVSRFVYELAALKPDNRQPYVGRSAFAHKGSSQVAAVQKNPETYEHCVPELVGNYRRVLISERSGRSNVVAKAAEFGLVVESENPAVKAVLQELKQQEHCGFQYEGAEGSFELLMQKALNGKVEHFRLVNFRVVDEKRDDEQHSISEATIAVEGPEGVLEHTAAVGNGPINALDLALRKALTKFYPQLEEMKMLDYQVQVLGSNEGNSTAVRVRIKSGDGDEEWRTMGVSADIIEASWQALVDSVEYKLLKDEKARQDCLPRNRLPSLLKRRIR